MFTVGVAFPSAAMDVVESVAKLSIEAHPALMSIQATSQDDAATWLGALASAVGHFLFSSVTVSLGIALLVIVVWLYRAVIGEGVMGLSSIAERILGIGRAEHPSKTVNVEYRDAGGRRMDFGPYITVTARGKRGGAAVLRNGVFVDGDPGGFTPGAIVDINVQDGLVREEAVVRMDFDRNMLFVQSAATFEQTIARIHRAPDAGQAAE
ncbi:MAG: hypothetical protein E6R08_08660 [Nevskiaceae bacterium]|nr:MAG: hypothetical protein E6R08_08660 [Nevskiaceae bacterium]